MITVRVKIGDGAITDTADLGLIYLDSDKRVGSDNKGYESTSYPEEAGEHILPKIADAPFDYKVKFFVDPNFFSGNPVTLQNVNKTINAFNKSLYTLATGSTLKTYKQVTFYNDYKRHKIVGYPYEISEATDFWRGVSSSRNDIAVVEWTIRVNDPSLCEYETPFSDDSSN